MTLYAVLAPADRAGSTGPEPDRFVFVKEGFCWPAFFVTIPWLIWRGMWLVLVIYLLVMTAVLALADVSPPLVAWTIVALFAGLVGLEANNLRRWALQRRGHRFLGVVAGDRRSEAEFRFFAGWTASPAPERSLTPRTTLKPVVGRRPAAPGEIVGLFPTAGARP